MAQRVYKLPVHTLLPSPLVTASCALSWQGRMWAFVSSPLPGTVGSSACLPTKVSIQKKLGPKRDLEPGVASPTHISEMEFFQALLIPGGECACLNSRGVII